MKFFLDTECNGFSGEVFSLALANMAGDSIYLVDDEIIARLTAAGELDPWVRDNVIPYIDDVPVGVPICRWPKQDWPIYIGEFLYRDPESVTQVYADFPLDIAALLELMMETKDQTVPMPHQTHFTVLRKLRPPVYPTSLEDAVRHNAWWDAMALRQWFTETTQ